eukprot:1717653-Amphidinium_carterae.1
MRGIIRSDSAFNRCHSLFSESGSFAHDEEMRVYMHTSYELNESSPSGSGSRCVILYTALSQQQADAINSEKHLQKLLEDKLDELQ